MKNNNKSWYSIIVSVMIIWFLMVVTTWVLNLVLLELKDTKWWLNYMRAYSAAEWAWELALLKIKQEWYAYVDKIDDRVNNRSIVLANDPLDTDSFNNVKDAYISYDFNYKVNEYSWELATAAYDIIPLFHLTYSWEQKVNNITLEVEEWDDDKLTWNLIWENSGISGVWEISSSTIWKWRKPDWSKLEKSVWNFLSENSNNYLILFNTDPDDIINYTLESDDPDEYFVKPRTDIISSAQIWKYRQNLQISLDNTEFLNILRYSIYSK